MGAGASAATQDLLSSLPDEKKESAIKLFNDLKANAEDKTEEDIISEVKKELDVENAGEKEEKKSDHVVAAGVDWNSVYELLPIDKELGEKRAEMFKAMDKGTGYITIDSVCAYFGRLLKDLQIENIKPVIRGAYDTARIAVPSTEKNPLMKGGKDDDFVQKSEFRVFLLALRQRLECYSAFKILQGSNNEAITLSQFKEEQVVIEKLLGEPINDIEAEFQKIDRLGKKKSKNDNI